MKAIYKETIDRLQEHYGRGEAESISHLLFEDLLGIPRTKRLTGEIQEWNASHDVTYQDAMERLLKHEPIQHITGHAHFYGHVFSVNRHTLIPRPETEELVDLIVRENQAKALKILDIGTGSGCIAIALNLSLTGSKVIGWDISKKALDIADRNARDLNAQVDFHLMDILKDKVSGFFDLIVSNPPYIPVSDQKVMRENVLQFEPYDALFVTDDDPLLFYRAIGLLGKSLLNAGGRIYFEIHENFGNAIRIMLKKMGYDPVIVYQDMQGKDRMINAEKP